MTILSAAQEAASMGHWKKASKRAKRILRLHDLEQSKNAVLNSLPAPSSQESYRHAIDEFIGWYCSEPRLAFNRSVVLRYRFFLEQKNLAPSTIKRPEEKPMTRHRLRSWNFPDFTLRKLVRRFFVDFTSSENDRSQAPSAVRVIASGFRR